MNFLLTRPIPNSLTNPTLQSTPQKPAGYALAPTSSTTMSLIIGDCLAIALLELKGFKSSHFKNLHPGGTSRQSLTGLGFSLLY